ncbi:DUF2254 domain-containing protein [Actinotalea sp. BY-33]|uniref:DUF2254 domain-containing protein n=1 Tax=Actinotalea soli TaxID=2819234 RepID=A0A939LPW6_9CELL|nr:DUF2254 domain-containing protein [Actinotalea soli]MBO1751784.1 DUF2254 domain-containing protein [Actinotalea soli]
MSGLRRVSERFWFIPALLCVLAAGLAEGLTTLDERRGDARVRGPLGDLLYSVGESGSRDLLGAIATSSLAVAGTTFSITMAVLALTSSSYGPRLVRNFMADRGNQTVLGVFVATFLYSLLVLRSIRVLGDTGEQEADVFVPHLAVNAAVLLAVANVAVLVYFIHHISDSVQVATLARGVREELCDTVERLYPSEVGHDRDDATLTPARDATAQALPVPTGGTPVPAGRPGYVQSVAEEKLLRLAVRHDLVVRLEVRPGRYVLPDTTIARLHPVGAVDERLVRAAQATIVVTDERTPHQDVEFAVQQLTEMAVRALSPGTNDPYTAINALDDLSAGLAMLAARQQPSAQRFDQDGTLRVHAPAPGTTGLVRGVLDSMRWYAAGAPSVMHHTLELVERVGVRSRDPELRVDLVRQLGLLEDAFAAAGHHEQDTRGFGEHARNVRAAVAPG